MTTYSPIANGSVDAGSPVDESLVTALRDNPIAISEGSTGAPKIQTAAYDANSVDQAAIESAIKAKYLIESVTMSATSHTFAAVSGYDRYKIEWEFTSGAGFLGLQVGNGAPTTGNNYEYVGTFLRVSLSTVTVERDTSNDSMKLGGDASNCAGHAYIMGANITSNYTLVKSVNTRYASNDIFDHSVSSVYKVQNNADVFKIGVFGNITTAIAGKARLYGYRS